MCHPDHFHQRPQQSTRQTGYEKDAWLEKSTHCVYVCDPRGAAPTAFFGLISSTYSDLPHEKKRAFNRRSLAEIATKKRMELFRGSLLRLEEEVGGNLEGWGFEKLIGGGFVWKGKHASFVREKRSKGGRRKIDARNRFSVCDYEVNNGGSACEAAVILCNLHQSPQTHAKVATTMDCPQ